ncbi:MAG TPA: DUF418 domain-containing protein [Phycisphaerae bacterium]|nr:DUF418 domain-containing protein [Phycisphaerae bacterium]HRW52146.1 DUF418 domain-containing protein [Phycisphaerae bacterium]
MQPIEPYPIPTAIPVATAHAATTPAERLSPTAEADRIDVIDALRGVALLGILLVNIIYFSEGFSSGAARDVSLSAPLDEFARFLSRFFANYKFVTLYSVLFGMGLALQSRRADERGTRFTSVYVRRLLILLAMGLIHGVFLWYGDILTMYALLGLIAMLFRHAKQMTLLVTATLLAAVPLVLIPPVVALDYQPTPPAGEESRSDVMSPVDDDCEFAGESDIDVTTPPLTAKPVDFNRLMSEFDSIEVELYGRGPYALSVVHRGMLFVVMQVFAGATTLGWRCLAMFLVGVAIIRSGMFDQLKACRRGLIRCVTIAMPIGMAIQAIGVWAAEDPELDGYLRAIIPEVASYTGAFGLTAGYFAIVCLISLSERWHRALLPFAAAGRLALTNYIGQSILCGLVFYSYGLGWIGRTHFATTFLIACGVFSAQVVFSVVWLRFFRFGPLEWLWRSLTYGKRQPMTRTPR